MEVGAVKQAFNNEIIQLKKNLNQAKTQTIHKLTRKAKTLADKMAPEAIKEKFNKKAESAVKEVLIIKKIKPKDIAQFIVTHKGQLNEFMNKPLNNDKACARLLLHKALQTKYKQIREKFSNISIKDLFMSRQERLKIKKEARDKQKNKKKGKDKTVNVEGEWDVEMTDTNKSNDSLKSNVLSEDENESNDNNDSDVPSGNHLDNESDKSDEENDNDNVEIEENNDSEGNEVSSEEESSAQVRSNAINITKKVNKEENNIILPKVKKDKKPKENKNRNLNEKLQKRNFNKDNDNVEIEENNDSDEHEVSSEEESPAQVHSKAINITKKVNKEENNITLPKVKKDKKPKENKNRNLNEKLQKRNFNKDSNDGPLKASMIADPFFITSSGQNYMSLVEPRQPDEVKEIHKQGNRQQRRAVMFGHAPKSRPRRNNHHQTNNIKENQWKANKFEEKRNKFDRNNDVAKDEVPEKLHPSWEAKKKQSSILPFQGKKIVFN